MISDLDDIFPQDPPKLIHVNMPATISTYQPHSNNTPTPDANSLPVTAQPEPQTQHLEGLPANNTDHVLPHNHEEVDVENIDPDSLVPNAVEEVTYISPEGSETINTRKSTRHSRPY